MTITTQAIYVGGVLRPLQPVGLAEGETVVLTIAPATAAPIDEVELVHRSQACQTYGDWLDVTNSLPGDDSGYDIVRALDDNRRWCGS